MIVTFFENYLLTRSKIVFVLRESEYSVQTTERGRIKNQRVERGYQAVKINWELSLE